MDIKVVGGLIKKEDIGVSEKCLCKKYPEFPAWGDFAHRTVMQRFFDACTQQNFPGAAFSAVAVQLCKLHFEICHFQAISFAHFRQRVDSLPLKFHFRQCFVTHDDRVDDRESLESELILV